ncbi:hypothetical protein AB0M79_25495 [Polymorphospora sp. NPDC051019]|uniref:hypothetical protein n=1 Tax=Polymorphospora sp. NPDC051019 TaxID=3155725 RepID=UPI00341E7C2C
MTGDDTASTRLAAGPDRTLPHRATYQERRGPAAEINLALVAAELAELTRDELLVLVPAPHRLPLPAHLFESLRARGVTVRLLHAAVPEPPAGPLAALARGGIALPTSSQIPYFLVIRDRAVLYLPYQDSGHPKADRLTRMRNVVLAGSLAAAYGAVWEAAARRAEAARVAAGIDGVEGGRDLVRVLGDGLTDQQAAARLHMSKRTFARRVAVLMQRLDAATRFQAGVQAARRGWV